MHIIIAVVGFIFILPSTIHSRPFPVDSLHEVLPVRSLSSHNGMILGSGIGNIKSDISNILSDSLIHGNQGVLNRRNIEAFPILSYDTDTKLGYGAKLFLFNLLKLHESFDMVLFNSTNGEQWYHFFGFMGLFFLVC